MLVLGLWVSEKQDGGYIVVVYRLCWNPVLRVGDLVEVRNWL